MKQHTRHIILIIAAVLALGLMSRPVAGQTPPNIDSIAKVVNLMPDNDEKLIALFAISANHLCVDTVFKYAEQMRILANHLGNRAAIARANQIIGWCYGCKGDYEKALSNHYHALIIYDSISDVLGTARCYNATGEDMLDLKDYNSADEYLHKAFEIYQMLGMESEYPKIYRNLGSMYKDYKLFETSKNYLKNAIEIDSSNQSLGGLMVDYNYLAEAEYAEYCEYGNKENIELAKHHNDISYEIAVELNDSSYLLYAIQSSLPICLDYADVLDSVARQHLLDSCVNIYHQAMELSRKFGYDANYYVLDNCRAKHLLLNHRYADCLEQLEKNSQQYVSNSNSQLQPDYDTYIKCYIAMGNYQKALEYKKLKDIAENQDDFLETTLNSSKSSTKDEFEQLLRQQEKEKHNRELLFEEHKKMVRIINIAIAIFIVFLITFALVALHEMRNRKANSEKLLMQKSEYEAQRNMLANINIQITDSIRYAKEIQNAVIPSGAIMNAIFGESLIIWKPLDIVSGNFYWATLRGRYKMLAVADCMRHGVPGAFISMLGITSLNDIAQTDVSENYCPTAAVMLDKLRTKIEKSIPQHDMSGPANMIDIALCIIDTDDNTMQFAGAHSPMFIVRNGNLTVIKSDDVHIGEGSDNRPEFTNTKVALHDGDIVYLYTDGIASQLNEAGDQPDEKLARLLTKNSRLSFAAQKDAITKALTQFDNAGDIRNQTDDILLVGIRI